MTNDNSFTILIQGISLPEEVRVRIESKLKSVVLAEIAESDLVGNSQLTVSDLPQNSTSGAVEPRIEAIGRTDGFAVARA